MHSPRGRVIFGLSPGRRETATNCTPGVSHAYWGMQLCPRTRHPSAPAGNVKGPQDMTTPSPPSTTPAGRRLPNGELRRRWRDFWPPVRAVSSPRVRWRVGCPVGPVPPVRSATRWRCWPTGARPSCARPNRCATGRPPPPWPPHPHRQPQPARHALRAPPAPWRRHRPPQPSRAVCGTLLGCDRGGVRSGGTA